MDLKTSRSIDQVPVFVLIRAVGELMNIYHGLPDAIGVRSAKLSRLVHAVRDAGAYGAKITVAGGGGCITRPRFGCGWRC